ncbi:glycerophosphoryl diester phosphodiesterase [Rhypophila decipiens]
MVTESSPLLGVNLDAGGSMVSPLKTREKMFQKDGTPLPSAIAHRGYKAAYPENTMAAFAGAVQVGAHAIETDLHLSKDGVVMLSHDATLKRCFGVDEKVSECDSSYLGSLRTIRQPPQPMPQLSELLHYLENEKVWLLLDIKTDDDPEELLSRTAETINSVPTSRPWNERIVLGGWNIYYIELCRKYFPGFVIANIGFLPYAFKYLKEPDIDFNILQPTLLGPAGKHFVKKVKKLQRKLYVWTVNEEHWMEWSIRKKVDGVITDDPKLFLEVCERFSLPPSKRGDGNGGSLAVAHRRGPSTLKRAKLYITAFMFQVFVFSFTLVFWRRVAKMGMAKPKVQTQAKVPTAA